MNQQIANDTSAATSVIHQTQFTKPYSKPADKPRKTPLALAMAAALAFPVPALAAPGDPRGGEFRVNTTTLGTQDNPSIANDAEGNFVVVWNADEVYGVFAQRYNNAGVAQGGQFQVNTPTSLLSSTRLPDVAMDADGDFVVVWDGSAPESSSGRGFFAQRFNRLGVRQGGEFRLSGRGNSPEVAMDADGDFVLVWTSYVFAGRSDSFAQRYNRAGVPQGTQFQVNTTTGGRHFRPAVALDADGDFVVAWINLYTANDGISAQRFDSAGVPQGGELRVSTAGRNAPSIALDADGDFVVAWAGFTGGIAADDIFASRFDSAGVRQGNPFQVNTSTAGNQRSPAVALDADGDFVVTWQSSSQTFEGLGIFAQRFDSAGSPQSGEFRASTSTNFFADRSVVALDADGDFVVAWQSYLQDGDEYGIFAQRFEGPQKVFCGGVSASFVGTSGADTLIGTAGNDVISGLDGNDIIAGLSGNDLLCGGPGNDALIGGNGQDLTSFELAVAASLATGTASGEGADLFSGIEGLVGSPFSDTLRGNSSNNVLFGRGGDDQLFGGDGMDTVYFLSSPSAVTVDLATGSATGEGSDALVGIENVIGSQFADTLAGNAGTNLLVGLGGNDVLNGAGGSDWVSFNLAPSGVSANLATGTASGEGNDTLTSIENLIGSRFNDNLQGDSGDNMLFGLLGDDSLNGQGGRDFASFTASPSPVTANLDLGSASGEGNDTLSNIESLLGSNFADTLIGNGSDNLLFGMGGNDILEGLSGNDTLNGGAGDDALDGGTEVDTCEGGTQVSADTAVNCESVTGLP